jgi:hypothetical protein
VLGLGGVVSGGAVFRGVLPESLNEVTPVLDWWNIRVWIGEGASDVLDSGVQDVVASDLGFEMRDLLLALIPFLVDVALLPSGWCYRQCTFISEMDVPNQRFLVNIRVSFNVGVVRELFELESQSRETVNRRERTSRLSHLE